MYLTRVRGRKETGNCVGGQHVVGVRKNRVQGVYVYENRDETDYF